MSTIPIAMLSPRRCYGKDVVTLDFTGLRGGSCAAPIEFEEARILHMKLGTMLKEHDAKTGYTNAGLVDAKLAGRTP